MDKWQAVTQRAERQYGLIERRQAATYGVRPSTLNERADREGWARVHPGVLALPGSVDSPHRRVMAAVLAVQNDAWATGWTAAFLWGLVDRLRVPVTVLVPHGHRAAALHGVKTVRSRNVDEEDLAVRAGIPTVQPARLITDLAPTSPVSDLRGLAIDARQKGLLDDEHLWRLWERFGASLRHTRLGPVAKEMLSRDEQSDSGFERWVRGAFRKAALPPPHPEPYPVCVDGRVVARIDVAWPRWKVGVECDGYRYHSERRQLDRDTERQNRLVALGWTIIRVTWSQMRDDPAAVTRLVHRILADAGAI